MKHAFHSSRRGASFAVKIMCRSGVLSFSCYSDFLIAVLKAKQEKARLAAMLPSSTLRVQLLFPNGERASKQDLRAAINALADHRIDSALSARLAASQSSFCQAGVVAPPDSPDLGNPVEVAFVVVEV